MAQAETLTRTRRIRRADQAKYLRRRFMLVIVGSLIMLALGCGVGMLAGWLLPYQRMTALAMTRPTFTRPQNILVMGVDINYDPHGHPVSSERARTDFLMLAHLEPGSRLVKIISIPRDTQVLIPGYGTAKINVAHAMGGSALTVRVVQALLGVPIDHYALVSIPTALRLLDQVAPIHLYIPTPIHYVDRTAKLNISFKRGWDDLSGQQIINYARFRHDALGDIGRIGRQQLLLHAIAQKMMSPATFWRLPRMLALASQLVNTDMSAPELAGLAAMTRGHLSTQFVTLPGSFGFNGYWLPNMDQIARLVDDLDARQKPMTSGKAAPGIVEILFPKGQESSATLLASKLTDLGLEVIRTAPMLPDQVGDTRIIERHQDSPWDGPIKHLLPDAPWKLSDALDAYSADYTIIMGPDYPL